MDFFIRCAFCAVVIISGAISFEIVTPPSNASVGTGQDLLLRCEVQDSDPSEFIEWREFITSSQSGVRIWLSPDTGIIAHPNSTKYAVSGKFDLTVRGVTVYDGGMYSCGLLVAGTRNEAQVYVIEKPVCSVESQEVVEGDEVNVTCFAEFGGNKKPEVYLEDENNNRPEISQYDEIYSRKVVYNFNTTWQDDNRKLKCFSNVYGPDYSDNCTVTLDVKYPVRNITFEPKENVYFVGEEVNCSTSGNPDPEITWESLSGGGTVRSHVLPITSEMMSQYQQWKCTARNTIRTTSFVTVAHHNFSVLAGSTQSPSGASWTLHINTGTTVTLLLLYLIARF